MDLPKRRVILEIQTDDKTVKTFDGLNVNFNVSKQASEVTPYGRIVVANLTMEDVVNITTIVGTYTDVKKRKKVRLYAGYDDDVGLIFEGDITSAAPITEPPDVWMQIEATNGFFDNNRVVSKTIKDKTPIKNIAEQIANWLKVPLQWMATTNKVINLFSASGSAGQFIRKLNNLGDILAFKDEEGLITRIRAVATYSDENGVQQIISTYVNSEKINDYETPFISEIDFTENFTDGEIPTIENLTTLAENYFTKS